MFLDTRESGCWWRELTGGILGGDESAVRSTKSLRSSLSGQGVSSRPELEIPGDDGDVDDKISSDASLVGCGGALAGVTR